MTHSYAKTITHTYAKTITYTYTSAHALVLAKYYVGTHIHKITFAYILRHTSKHTHSYTHTHMKSN